MSHAYCVFTTFSLCGVNATHGKNALQSSSFILGLYFVKEDQIRFMPYWYYINVVVLASPLGAQDYGNSTLTGLPVSV